MRQDLAWPGLRDFGSDGSFYEYFLRVVCAAAFALSAALVYWLAAKPPVPPSYAADAGPLLLHLWKLPPYGSLVAIPFALLGFWSFPLRVLLRPGCRMRPAEWGTRPSGLSGVQSLNRVPEPSFWGTLSVALVLASFSGPLANLSVLLLFAPFVVFRLCSTLWTSLDLDVGRVQYHRAFFGLVLTRPGPDLNELEAVVSGERVARPEQPDQFAVYMIGPRWQRVAINTQYESLEASHDAGRALSLQLDVPHYRMFENANSLLSARSLDEVQASRSELWDALALALPYPEQRPRLPDEGGDA
jgi:hypothetical protein